MERLGIDIGSESVKLAFVRGDCIEVLLREHHGKVRETLRSVMDGSEGEFLFSVTGKGKTLFTEEFHTGEIDAAISGAKELFPLVGSILEIGSENTFFISGIKGGSPVFSSNTRCAGGTGSFLSSQMTRLGLGAEQFAAMAGKSNKELRLSGRCAVFSKSDVIHRLQEGERIEDILNGLSLALSKNIKSVIIRNIPIDEPLLLIGGVSRNSSVVSSLGSTLGVKVNVDERGAYADAIGAAMRAKRQVAADGLSKILRESEALMRLPERRLALPDGIMKEGCPKAKRAGDELFLGIDVGSTSTDLVVIDSEDNIIDYLYLRTLGNPEKAMSDGIRTLKGKLGGNVRFSSIGVTGSGRDRLGKLIGADKITDEITCQARAARYFNPDADTVFEIGGQDSKFIRVSKGGVDAFSMNKICAAGTGAFLEEMCPKLGITISELGPLALESKHDLPLSDRCTVFMEMELCEASSMGVSTQDLAASLCRGVVKNYVDRTVGGMEIGGSIVLQGGVCYNPGIVASFSELFPGRISVSPVFQISGAFGSALIAKESLRQRKSSESVKSNVEFYGRAEKAFLDGYDGTIDKNKKTVGIPLCLMIHKFFPLANAFFKALGFNVLLSGKSDEEAIALAEESCTTETCYPVKLLYGHMLKLAKSGVDYIFMPSIHTLRHEKSRVKFNYGCVYMQASAKAIWKSLRLGEMGIKLLNPIFDLDFGKEAMAMAMVPLGSEIGKSKEECKEALRLGSMAVRKHTAFVEELGEELISSLSPDEKAIVIITRNYGISDPVLNMGIPRLLMERGCKVLTLSHLHAHGIDLGDEYPNLYWPFAQHIISGAKIIRGNPNLYAVYLTNHGCGPDSVISRIFEKEMEGKPYLQIEVDEHFSPIGVITRIEAFLESIKDRKDEECEIRAKASGIRRTLDGITKLYLPDYGRYNGALRDCFSAFGAETIETTMDSIAKGKALMRTKECYSYAVHLSNALSAKGDGCVLIPENEGADADGLYATAIGEITGNEEGIYAPITERLGKEDVDKAIRALASAETGAGRILSWDNLFKQKRSVHEVNGKRVLMVGEAMTLNTFSLQILETVKKHAECDLACLSECLLFILYERHKGEPEYLEALKDAEEKLMEVDTGCFHSSLEDLASAADKAFPLLRPSWARYRFAKTSLSSHDAVINIYPRYENSGMMMNMMDIRGIIGKPYYEIPFDLDFDEGEIDKLSSFLHYSLEG